MNEAWGLRPVLFRLGDLSVPSYPVFIALALAAGLASYALQSQPEKNRKPASLYIAIFALTGGAIGAKLPLALLGLIDPSADTRSLLYAGRTIVGGLVGGAVFTFLAKKLFRIRERLGNQLAVPVALGMAVGRVGCLLRGCCYGKPAAIPWAVDFGDGIGRHPTQAYEILFDLALVVFLTLRKRKENAPGALFTLFLDCYLGFRFFLEFIRVEPVVFSGLTAFQLLCLVGLAWIHRPRPWRTGFSRLAKIRRNRP